MPRVAGQAGRHWGSFATTSDLPNVSGAATQSADLSIGDLAVAALELYTCLTCVEGSATWAKVASAGETITTLTTTGDVTVGGDVAATGGFRQTIGPFTAPGAAGVIAADQTNLDLRYSHTVTAAALSFVAPRAGSIMSISGQLSAAITGATKTCIISATVNGTEVALAATFTTGGAETTKRATAAKDTYAFAAGDVIGVSYTTTTITNTPALVCSLEVEM